jgi:hypothetical protein
MQIEISLKTSVIELPDNEFAGLPYATVQCNIAKRICQQVTFRVQGEAAQLSNYES